MPISKKSHSAPALQHTSLTDGVTFDVDADGLFEATFEGGAGTDTLNLVGGGSFDLTAAILSSIEVVRGTDQDDTVLLDALTLTDIETLDGGTGSNTLRLNGSELLDFTGRTVTGFSRLEATSKKFDVIFDDKATALNVWAQKAVNDTLTLVGGTFTDDERAQLHRQGVDTIIDDSGSYTNETPRLSNFSPDRVYTSAGQVFLDRDQDAAIGAMDDHFGSLKVTFEDLALLAGQITIIEGEGITLSDGMNDGSQILFNGSLIGELALLDDGISVSFDEAAGTDAVEALLHRLVYKNLDDSSSIREVYATITLTDEGGRAAHTNVAIMTGGPGIRFFDHGTDALQGTAGDDAFATDTLSLGTGDALDGGDGHRHLVPDARRLLRSDPDLPVRDRADRGISGEGFHHDQRVPAGIRHDHRRPG
jgi:hypothetical protein